jgi:oxygen-dependent protoporphyrinogen oxidase
MTLRGGMDGLVSAIVDAFESTRVVTGCAVARVAPESGGYRIDLDDGSSLETDGLVLAVPAYAVAELLGEIDDALASAHAEIPYASSVVVTLAYGEGDVADPLDGYGYVVPRVEGTDVLACTWTSQKWAGRAPEGAHLIRVYAGRFGSRDLTRESDADLLSLARGELSLLGLDVEPILIRVRRLPLGMPQYTLGHPDRLARIEAALAEHPGLAVAGAAYHGVGIPDCIRSGEDAAGAVAHSLSPALR